MQEDKTIPFLDVLLVIQEDGLLGHKVYRKPTHTDRYLHYNSFHHPSIKNSVCKTLINRAKTICEVDNIEGELEHFNFEHFQTADYINTFFTSLTKDYPRINSEWLSFGSAEYLPKISVQSVTRRLFHIDVNKAPGPFDPNLKLLKMFPEYFAIPLTDIYNQSFNYKIFPEVWKISNIASVPKLQPCSTVEDLRPIALTSVLSKIQESYVMEWVLEDTRDRISDS